MRKAIFAVALLLLVGTLVAAEEKIVAGFIYVGPIGDLGWTYAHNAAREIVDQEFDWLETVYVESVAEGQAGPVIDRLVAQG